MIGNHKVFVLLAAAGAGTRFGGELPKQYTDMDGKPMIVRAAEAFEKCAFVDEIYAVADADYMELCAGVLSDSKYRLDKYRGTVAGAEVRQESVRLGLESLPAEEEDIVLIHDAARPFVQEDVILRVIEAAVEHGAAIACVPVTDTIYEVAEDSVSDGYGSGKWLGATPSRERLMAVQTPQGFRYGIVKTAHERAKQDGFLATDDGTLAKRYGGEVRIVDGDPCNIKVTNPGDI
jgi:2-C-methyl-D-erythritol 4-phosphate cytidylyltransferase